VNTAEAVYALYDPDTGEIRHVHRIIFGDGEEPPNEAGAAEQFQSFGHPVDELRIASVDPADLDLAAGQRVDPQTGRLTSE
jgi:hypothetical protein